MKIAQLISSSVKSIAVINVILTVISYLILNNYKFITIYNYFIPFIYNEFSSFHVSCLLFLYYSRNLRIVLLSTPIFLRWR